MMAAELKYPGIGNRRLAEERDVIKIASEHVTARWPSSRTARAVLSAKRRRLAVLTSRRRAVRRAARSCSGAALRSIGFEIVIGLPDFVHLLESHGTENYGQQLHGGVALRSAHLFETDSAATHYARRKVRPPGPLFVVVEGVEHLLALIGVERRQESIGGAHDTSGRIALLSLSRYRKREGKCGDDEEQVAHRAPVNFMP